MSRGRAIVPAEVVHQTQGLRLVHARETAVVTLQSEHRSLGIVLHTLQVLLKKVAQGHAVADFGLLASALYYIDDFPERCHHPKEAAYLFTPSAS